MTGIACLQSGEYFSALASELQQEPSRIHGVAARQTELGLLVDKARKFAFETRLLELACGVGFWTRHFASVATLVHATDLEPRAVAIARVQVPAPNVRFDVQDAAHLDLETSSYDKVFAGFLISHILRGHLRSFFERLNAALQPGTTVMLVDNALADRTLRPIHSIDAEGNTYERRSLRRNCPEFRVLKNYYSDSELAKAVAAGSMNMMIERGHYYWLIMYVVAYPNSI